MSVQAMSYVIEHSRCKGSALLLLIMIANYARKDGTGAWPSLETLAADCRMSKRQVARLITEIEGTGELFIERNQGPYRTNLYSIPGMQGDGDILSPPLGQEVVTSGALDGDKLSVDGDTQGADGDIAMSPNPSKNRPLNPLKTSRVAIAKAQHPECEKVIELEDGTITGFDIRSAQWKVLMNPPSEAVSA